MKQLRVHKQLISFFLFSMLLFVGSAFLIVQFPSSNVNNGSGSDNIKLNQNSQLELSDILANKIYLSQNTITDWYSKIGLVARGLVLGEVDVSDLDQVIQNYRSDDSWKGVLKTKRQSELLNYSSQTIDDAVKWALSQTPMFKHYSLPVTESDNYFWMWRQYILYGYRYAKELNYLTDKWDPTSAFEGLRNCRITNGRAFYQCNPDTNSTSSLFGTRWMNTANLANSFMILFKETGLTEAMDYALQEWSDLNTHYWNENKQGYEYSRTWETWEWSTINVFFDYDKLRKLNGGLENWDRVHTDLQSRYLVNEWSSPQWGSKVVVHSEGASQRRLQGTLDAWMLLLTYFGHFEKSNQIRMQNMLEGESVTQAWQALLSSGAQLYDPGTFRFKKDSTSSSYSDFGTAEGCMTLFLMGISPQNGSGLIIPKRCHDYSAEPFPADVFRFIHADQQIVIPVYGGTTLKFLYGSLYPNYTFTDSGIYRLTFSSDWNSIINVEQISAIPTDPLSTQTLTSSPTTDPSFPTTPTSSPTTVPSSPTTPTSSPTTNPSSPTTVISSPTTTSSSPTIATTSKELTEETNSQTAQSSDPQTASIPIIGIQSGIIVLVILKIHLKKSRD